jgi:hypothetical protein
VKAHDDRAGTRPSRRHAAPAAGDLDAASGDGAVGLTASRVAAPHDAAPLA